MKCPTQYLLLFAFITVSPLLKAQPANMPQKVAGVNVNYDEALVGTYTLPDPLVLNNGKSVTDAKTWMGKRRPEILQMFETIQYGKLPPKPADMWFKMVEKATLTLGGKAIRKQVTVYFTKDTGNYKMNLLIYLPARPTKPSPVLLTLSFVTNAMAVNDSAVAPGFAWIKGKKEIQTTSPFGKADVLKFIDAGIGYATVYYGDIEPDFKDGIHYGIRNKYLKPGATQPASDEWGAISAWSWGLSRAMDYFEKDKDIDAKKIAINGASRLGKTVLWTGARDQRFAIVIPSISGESGAALSRRNYGETLKIMTDTGRYFYQFAANYHSYADRVNELPMDSHMLIALVAPRPILLQTGDQDFFSDPKGEFLAAKAAEPIYHLFGKPGIGKDTMPEAGDTSMLNTVGYYMHKGGHTVLPEDYTIFINFMKKHFGE